MFLLAHLAAGYILGRIWNLAFRRRAVNPYLTSFGGILPDLVDKPLALLPGWDAGRGVAHTALFTLLLLALTRLHRNFLPLGLGTATHLLLDDPTTYIATFAWPLLGPTFTIEDDMSFEALQRHLAKPRTALAELFGGLLAAALAAQHAWSKVRQRRTRVPVTNPQVGRIITDPLNVEKRPAAAEAD